MSEFRDLTINLARGNAKINCLQHFVSTAAACTKCRAVKTSQNMPQEISHVRSNRINEIQGTSIPVFILNALASSRIEKGRIITILSKIST
jgi:hypothetical protein